MERLKDRLLDQPQVVESGIALWNALRRVLQGSLLDPEGAVRARLASELAAFGARLREDPALRAVDRLRGRRTSPSSWSSATAPRSRP